MILSSPGEPDEYNIIRIQGDDSRFNCLSTSVTFISVEWLINGTRLEDLSFTNVETPFTAAATVETLLFNNISVEYNNTNIQCRATYDNGDTADSNNITLLVQGERNDYNILREPHKSNGDGYS